MTTKKIDDKQIKQIAERFDKLQKKYSLSDGAMRVFPFVLFAASEELGADFLSPDREAETMARIKPLAEELAAENKNEIGQ